MGFIVNARSGGRGGLGLMQGWVRIEVGLRVNAKRVGKNVLCRINQMSGG